jgi:hypothetical protein
VLGWKLGGGNGGISVRMSGFSVAFAPAHGPSKNTYGVRQLVSSPCCTGRTRQAACRLVLASSSNKDPEQTIEPPSATGGPLLRLVSLQSQTKTSFD